MTSLISDSQNTNNGAAHIKTERASTEADLAACIAIRVEVFVDEQQVPVADEMDGIDDQCLHYLTRAAESSRPIATARLIPKEKIAKIGRVAVLREFRGQGIGLAMMRFVISEAQRMGFTESVLDSQTYAIPFYQRLGYAAEGEEFLDGGIPHYKMRRSLVVDSSGAAY